MYADSDLSFAVAMADHRSGTRSIGVMLARCGGGRARGAALKTRPHQEASRTAGGVANDVAGLRGGQLNHQPNDVARGAELPVLARRGDLAEHVIDFVVAGAGFEPATFGL